VDSLSCSTAIGVGAGTATSLSCGFLPRINRTYPFYDGDAISVREALALGVPVVASDTDYRPEDISE